MTPSPSTDQRPTGRRSSDKAWLERYCLVKHLLIICAPAIVALLAALTACVGPLARADAVLTNPIIGLPAPNVKMLGDRAGGGGFSCSLGTADGAVAASGPLRLRHDLVGPLRCPVAGRSEAAGADETGAAAPFHTSAAIG